MKKYVMNKYIIHNGHAYPKGHHIKESDEGFKMLLEAGHIHEHESAEPVVEKSVDKVDKSEKKKA